MPRTTKTPSIQSQSREPDSKAFIKNLTGRPVEVDPIQEEDEICEEYKRLDEEIRVLVARQKELKCDVEQRLIVQDEEGEDRDDLVNNGVEEVSYNYHLQREPAEKLIVH